jgi:hypothetical protein
MSLISNDKIIIIIIIIFILLFCPAYGRWDSPVSKCGELILILASE